MTAASELTKLRRRVLPAQSGQVQCILTWPAKRDASSAIGHRCTKLVPEPAACLAATGIRLLQGRLVTRWAGTG